ncbi:MarR family winged helix-turn-helix transcriptional regulator [Streptomyces sp. 769]|uniref:MarR family winged helix-turn-helix transcriptional regulator n=1 Tax=Streptomyces sp. 769 TaxID=1262452 RepID=UPI00057EAA6A|nr:MarR family winged helix-turn-helix transcriptional regulator [Streptomyces sp. 769]AJC55421.1 transcriptional regulator C MarR family protein [Streptomyces sp. 769]
MANGDLPDELADVLAGIQRLIRRRLRPGLPGPRLRGAEVELLRLVAIRPGIRVSAAAQELYLAGNSVSTLVNQLSGTGYLRRETDPADRRSALLFPTPAARSRLHDWETRRSALVREQLERLPETDRTALEAALPALRQLARNLHQQTEGP